MTYNGPVWLCTMTTLLASLDQSLNGWEKGGIVVGAGVIVAALWKRDTERTKREAARQLAAEKERLDVQKKLLEETKGNAANIQALLVASMTTQNESTAAIRAFTAKLESVGCIGRKEGT